MFNSDFWEDFFIFMGIIECGFIIALAIVALGIPKPDYTKDKQLCEKEGGVWTEVVHNRDLSYCTYFNNGG